MAEQAGSGEAVCVEELAGRGAPAEPAADGPAELWVQVRYRSAAGRRVVQEPEQMRGVRLEEHPPLSEPVAYKGRTSILTEWSAATSGLSVWCTSAAQRDAAMLLDFDEDIVCFQSLVAELLWEEDGGQGRRGVVRPAFFARTRDGQRVVIVHPPAAGEEGALEEQVVRVAARAARWQVRPLEVPTGVLAESLECLAHFRSADLAPDPELRRELLELFAAPCSLLSGAAACSKGATALGHVWHLLWTGDLTWHRSVPLLPSSTAWTSKAAARQANTTTAKTEVEGA
ncbi:hypothetical protein [Streptomyces syringium]|uniref:hypothetical protein n=1 Tax=Streptomyces syringium TaxID=76729 RepID=UPI0034478BFB